MARKENPKQTSLKEKEKKEKKSKPVESNVEDWDLESGDNPAERSR